MDEEREELMPCPACPDGQVWNVNGPTGKTCPTCRGFAAVKLNGGLCDEAEEQRNG